MEERLLESIRYDLTFDLPHTLSQKLAKEFNASSSVSRHSFQYCNDALNTTLVVRYSPLKIAQACIYLAASVCDEKLHQNDEEWYTCKKLNVKLLEGEVV